MSPEDQRLVAALIVLQNQLAPVVDEIAFGELNTDDRRELARALCIVADALAPIVDGEVARPRITMSGGAQHSLG